MLRHYCLLLIFLCTLTPSLLQGQEEIPFEKVIPPAPNAAKLAQFELTPTNLYTGAHSLSIPLYSFDLDGEMLALSVNYHSGGIRSNENASMVGLGWALSSIGNISRTVQGINDLSQISAFLGNVYENSPIPAELQNFNGYNWNDPYYLQNMQQEMDTQSDLFSYSFLNTSGKFVLGQKQPDGTIPVIKIEENADRIVFNESDKSFTVTTTSGFIGIFSQHEYVSTVGGSSDYDAINDGCYLPNIDFAQVINRAEHAITGWNLTKIISPKGKIVNFEYLTTPAGFSNHISISSKSFGESASTQSSAIEIGQDFRTQSCSRIVTEDLYLSKIYSEDLDIVIDLFYSDRADLQRLDETDITFRSWLNQIQQKRNETIQATLPAQKLDKIEVSAFRPQSSAYVHIVELQNSYFRSEKLGEVDATDWLRLRLDNIRVNDQYYGFQYYPGTSHKSTKGYDYWGFYNGKDNNAVLFPVQLAYQQLGPMFGYAFTPQNYYFQTDERKASLDHALKGTLSTVLYPTGGKTEYLYELHDYKLEGMELPEDNEVFYSSVSGINGTEQNKTFQYTGFGVGNCNGSAKLSLSTKCKDFYLGNDCNIEGSDVNIVGASLKKIDGTGVDINLPYSFQWGESTNYFEQEHIWRAPFYTEPQLPAGTYELSASGVTKSGEVKFYGDARIEFPASCLIDATSEPRESVFNQNAGGLRVRRITMHDEENNGVRAKQFIYASPDQGYKWSSGKLMNPLLNIKSWMLEGGMIFYYLTSGSQIKQGSSASGNHIGYSYVREVDVNPTIDPYVSNDIILANCNGFIDHYFHNQANTVSSYAPDNLLVIANKDYTEYNGKLRYQSHYTKEGRIRENRTFDYQYIPTGQINGIETRWSSSGGVLLFSFYHIPTGKYLITQESFTKFEDGTTTKRQRNYTTYSYDDEFLIKNTASYTDEDVLLEKVTYKRPLHYSNPSSSIQGMIERNLVETPIETIKERANGIIHASAVKIDELTASSVDYTEFQNKLFLPSSIYRLDIDNAYPNLTDGYNFTESVYDKELEVSYDPYGNLQEKRGRNGLITAYIWGYHGLFPIIEAQNASYTELTSVLSSTDLSNLRTNNLSDLELDQLMANLRTQLPHAHITNIKYDVRRGVTEIRDPNNRTTRYEYDTYGRLSKVYDFENNVVKQNQYNYSSVFEIDTDIEFVSSTSGQFPVSITANNEWNVVVTSGATWLSVSNTSAFGHGVFEVSYAQNSGSTNRQGSIQVSSGAKTIEFDVIQAGDILNISDAQLHFPVGGATENVEITSNNGWSIANIPSWLTVSPNSGSGNALPQSVSITASANTATRSPVTLHVTNTNGLIKTIDVSQDPYQNFLDVSSGQVDLSSAMDSEVVSLTSNVSWTISIEYWQGNNWLLLSDLQGTGNDDINIAVTHPPFNSGIYDATLTITGGGITRYVHVRLNI